MTRNTKSSSRQSRNSQVARVGASLTRLSAPAGSRGVAIPGLGAGPITKIPNRLFIASESDLVSLRLRYLTYPAHPDFKNAQAGNEVWFRNFFQAKNIASSEEYRPQLVATYCAPLFEMWSRLTDDERALVQSHSVQWMWQGHSGSARIDHNVVTSFCK